MILSHGVFAAASLKRPHRGFYHALLLYTKNEEEAIASKISRFMHAWSVQRENASIMATLTSCNCMPKITSRPCAYCIFITFYRSEN